MPGRKDSIFVAALLYSNARLKNKFEQNLLTCILGIIRKDDILSQTLHTICIDNGYCRDILRYNKSKTRIYNWPIFVIRYPGQKRPIVYSISSANQVFENVYDAYKRFRLSQGRTVPDGSPPEVSISSDTSDDSKNECEDIDLDKFPSCSCSPEKPSQNCQIVWNDHYFPHSGCGRTIYVKKNSLVGFKSTDRFEHDLVQTDCNWKILPNPDIDYRDYCRVNFEEIVLFDEVGTFYFTCTIHPERMKLTVVVGCGSKKQCTKKQQESSDVFDGIADRQDSDKRDDVDTIQKHYHYVQEYPHVCGKHLEKELPKEDQKDERKRHVTHTNHHKGKTYAQRKLEFDTKVQETPQDGEKGDFSIVMSDEDADKIQSLVDDLLKNLPPE